MKKETTSVQRGQRQMRQDNERHERAKRAATFIVKQYGQTLDMLADK